MKAAGSAFGLFAAAARSYWWEVFPAAHRELADWRARATRIPDPALRRDALFAHKTKGRRAEGLAAFAVLAAPKYRLQVIRAAVAHEVIVDYVDVVSERAVADPVANTLQLHGALEEAVDRSRELAEHYAFSAGEEDGGYLSAAIETCRANLDVLPSSNLVADQLHRWAIRDGEAQALNHAMMFGAEERGARCWGEETAAELGVAEGLRWWEMLAAAASPLAVGPLIAIASDPRLRGDDVRRAEGAYVPWVGALSGLLDSLVHFGEEGGGQNHLDRYDSESVAAERLGQIARRARELVCDLDDGGLHELLLAGMSGHFLAHPNAWLPGRRPVAASVLDALGRFGRPVLSVHCLRQGAPRMALRSLPGLATVD